MIYIVAGQFRHAEHCARALGLDFRRYVYVCEPNRLFGVARGSLVMFTDTAGHNPFYGEILQECQTRDLQCVVVDADRLP